MHFTVSVAGAAWTDEQNQKVAFELGKKIAESDNVLVCGGLEGVMEECCRGASTVENRKPIIGILPGADKKDANEYVDVAIPTTLGYIRNTLIPISSDVMVAISGGAGTLSEVTYAWQYDIPIIIMGDSGGWAEKLAGTQLDDRPNKYMKTANSVDEAIELIKELKNKKQ